MTVERFMALANARYYATRDPLGQKGDFITAPEISQMFGEIVGLALADTWQRAGRPDCVYVELGPGRGTLAEDALRAMEVAGLAPPVHFIETSPLLRDKQARAVPNALWHETIETLPTDLPLLIVANEFFDALPLRQFIRTFSGWRERMVGWGAEGFAATAGDEPMEKQIPDHLVDGDPGGIVERNPTAAAIMKALGARLAAQGGAMLAIDYGHHGHEAGDTLQALHAHAYADPFARPGSSDLSAHVDFTALAKAARKGGAHLSGPIEQGQWLVRLGISDRAAALTRGAPHRAEEIRAAYRRLTDAEEMGELFKVLGIHASSWPRLAGF
nr:SAM-dependent methyltransferase [Sphingomonas vulcanisoli]